MHIIYLYTHTSFFVTLLPMPVSPLPFFLLKAALQNLERKSLRLYNVNRRLLYDDNCAGRDDYFGCLLGWLTFFLLFVLLACFMVLPH